MGHKGEGAATNWEMICAMHITNRTQYLSCIKINKEKTNTIEIWARYINTHITEEENE